MQIVSMGVQLGSSVSRYDVLGPPGVAQNEGRPWLVVRRSRSADHWPGLGTLPVHKFCALGL